MNTTEINDDIQLYYDLNLVDDFREYLTLEKKGGRSVAEDLRFEAIRYLEPDLRAEIETNSYHSRAVDHKVMMKVVLLGGQDAQDRIVHIVLELLRGGTGHMYPALKHSNMRTNAEWRESIVLSLRHAEELGFGIPSGYDIRWHITFPPRSIYDDSPQAHIMTGRSAGVSFFLGLFALHHMHKAERAEEGSLAYAVAVERCIPFLLLPENVEDAMRNLGGTEGRKLAKILKGFAKEDVTILLPEGDSHLQTDLEVFSVARLPDLSAYIEGQVALRHLQESPLGESEIPSCGVLIPLPKQDDERVSFIISSMLYLQKRFAGKAIFSIIACTLEEAIAYWQGGAEASDHDIHLMVLLREQGEHDIALGSLLVSYSEFTKDLRNGYSCAVTLKEEEADPDLLEKNDEEVLAQVNELLADAFLMKNISTISKMIGCCQFWMTF